MVFISLILLVAFVVVPLINECVKDPIAKFAKIVVYVLVLIGWFVATFTNNPVVR